jgi:ferredoxin-type protein NapG
VRACPYGTLKLAPLAGPAAIGTPYFEPRQVPCYMCADLPCTKACPSGALDRALVDATRARMGVAVIDEASCLSWQGLRCEICHRACPVRGKAIRIETTPRRTSRHAVFEPVVDAEHCTGCGMCERACPTEVAAIRVLRAEYARGSVGAHYRMPERALREPEIDAPPAAVSPPVAPPVASAPPAGKPDATVPGLDYLNRQEPL